MDIAQIVSTAKEKLGSTSLSDRTFTEYFNAVNPQTEPDEAFWATHMAVLKSMNGQLSHDIAEWQKANAPKPPQTPPTPPTPPAQNPQVDPTVAALQESVKQLTALVTGQQTKMTQDAIRNSATMQGDTLRVNNKNLWNDAVNRTQITDGMTAEQFQQQVKTTYEQNLKLFVGDGVQPYGNAQPADPSAQTKAELDAFFAGKAGFEQK